MHTQTRIANDALSLLTVHAPEDIVFLHWRLLQEVSHLADPATPLEEKFDTLR